MLMVAAACAFSLAAADAYTIYPIPHAQIAGKAACSLSATTTVIAESGIDQPTKNRLCDVLKQHGIVAEFAAKPSKTNANIYLGVNGSKGDADRLAKKLKLKRDIFANGKFDRHIISLTAQKNGNAQLLILGENTDAVFFALASLEQMLDGGSSNMACVTIYDYADIKDRGVVEGYYGVPYSTAVTEDLLRFMMRYKMNSYMYGAKSDPYHSGYWGKPYPDKLTAEQKSMGCFTAADIKQMCEVSVATKVNFIWAIHPGVAFTGNDDAVIDRIMEKFEAMHGLGVRQFGVFVDDVGVPYDEPTLKLNAKRLTDLQNAID
ncbi:MAG: beta-N-acetylglucosaminidase domain-containing protein, partial [Muribaculaceae bacterium]|nr:beta-N-acetylglucosaminidase domain-containing protein [Muribaculaceae bacterium]